MALPTTLTTSSLADLGRPLAAIGRLGAVIDGCLPRRLRRWLAARHPVLVVVPAGDDAALWRQLGDEREPVGAVDLRTGGSLAAMVGEGQRRWSATALELPETAVLVRQLTLPVAVRDKLRQVVGYELDRLTPFAPDEVYYDVCARDTVARGAKLEVALAVCRRDRVADWLERLREGGAAPSRLTWVGAWPGANLLPIAERPRQRRLSGLLTLLLALLVLGLGAGLLVTPLVQKGQTQRDLEQEVSRLRFEAEAVGTLREELERARLGSVEVLQRKRAQPRMTDLLRDLTDLLPDNTWVQTLNLRETEVDIRGESTQATALIGLLEQAPSISNVSFRSPVMQVAATGSERFHIVLKFDPQTMP